MEDPLPRRDQHILLLCECVCGGVGSGGSLVAILRHDWLLMVAGGDGHGGWGVERWWVGGSTSPWPPRNLCNDGCWTQALIKAHEEFAPLIGWRLRWGTRYIRRLADPGGPQGGAGGGVGSGGGWMTIVHNSK